MLQDVDECFDAVIESYLQRMERKRKESEGAQDSAINKQRLQQLRQVATEMKENIIGRLVDNQDFWALCPDAQGAAEQQKCLEVKGTVPSALEAFGQRDIERCRELEAVLAQKKREEKELIDEIRTKMKAANECQMRVGDETLKRAMDDLVLDAEHSFEIDNAHGHRGAVDEMMALLEGIDQNTRAASTEIKNLDIQRRDYAEAEAKLTDRAFGTHLRFDDDTLEGSQLNVEDSMEDNDTDIDSAHLNAALERIQQAQSRFQSLLP